ncbi:MAG: hypothetical protein KKH28_06080 [Elusimicrobia bacterium]|nr:hypothetical protein [Elusimicrobiota bacterium]
MPEVKKFKKVPAAFSTKHPSAVFECLGILWKEKSLAEAGRHLNNLISQDY